MVYVPQIAFNSRRDGIDHVYLLNGGTGVVKQLTTGPYSDNYLSWSADGTKIAYEHHEDGIATYVMNADGTNQRRLSGSAARDTKASWSPDGRKLVYSWIADADSQPPKTEIRTMNASDGSGVTTLLSNAVCNMEPHYSPDGKKIMFFCGPWNNGMQVATINTDGSGFTVLTNGAYIHGDPNWSPDGQRILFGTNEGGLCNLAWMTKDGTNIRKLTQHPLGCDAGDGDYSPDGSQIVYEVAYDSNFQSDPTAYAEVWLMNADGSNQHFTGQVCSAAGACPRWRPSPEIAAIIRARRTSRIRLMLKRITRL